MTAVSIVYVIKYRSITKSSVVKKLKIMGRVVRQGQCSAVILASRSRPKSEVNS